MVGTQRADCYILFSCKALPCLDTESSLSRDDLWSDHVFDLSLKTHFTRESRLALIHPFSSCNKWPSSQRLVGILGAHDIGDKTIKLDTQFFNTLLVSDPTGRKVSSRSVQAGSVVNSIDIDEMSNWLYSLSIKTIDGTGNQNKIVE